MSSPDTASQPSSPAQRLRGRHVVLGITGGIAAYKSCELLRRLQDEGATVQVVMTEAATRFVSALTFQALSGRPVYTDAWSGPAISGPENAMPHIDLSREADAIVVAPATADFLSQLVHGQTRDLLGSLCLAREIPLLVAPAMNRQMWENPATQRNIAQLVSDGVRILGPGSGAQACGETGDGRMLEPAELLSAVISDFESSAHSSNQSSHQSADSHAHRQDRPNIRGVLQGCHVVITAGPTFEPIDPVRGITNRSSGKMGFALAAAAVRAGARVSLISGPVHLPTPQQVERLDVVTACEMHDAVMRVLDQQGADCFIAVAAVADWRPAENPQHKIKKESGSGLEGITWVENPDILAGVARRPDAPFCVGFAAETGSIDDLRALLPAKRLRKGVPLLAGNIGPDTFGSDHNQLLLCSDDGMELLAPADKPTLARELILRIARCLNRNPS